MTDKTYRIIFRSGGEPDFNGTVFNLTCRVCGQSADVFEGRGTGVSATIFAQPCGHQQQTVKITHGETGWPSAATLRAQIEIDAAAIIDEAVAELIEQEIEDNHD